MTKVHSVHGGDVESKLVGDVVLAFIRRQDVHDDVLQDVFYVTPRRVVVDGLYQGLKDHMQQHQNGSADNSGQVPPNCRKSTTRAFKMVSISEIRKALSRS